MKNMRSHHAFVNPRSHLALVAMLASSILLVGLVGTASAVPLIGKDGKIHACYRVKGKPKGNLRVVPSAKARCKRGERKVAWAVAGTSSQGSAGGQGSSGSSGSNGTQGSTGSQGAAGTPGSTAALSTQVASLNLKLEGIEDVLKGVDSGDLTGALSKLDGITEGDLDGVLDTVKGLSNGDLTEAVDAVPVVDTLCAQTGDLTSNLDGLGTIVEGLGVSPILKTLGLDIPSPPDALGAFDCTE
jgi:hypothetical protein